MIIFAKICKSNNYKGFVLLFVHPAKIYEVKGNISFSNSMMINKDSILCLIQNAVPTTAITITLHPDAYARLADDADIVSALEAQPLVSLVSA